MALHSQIQQDGQQGEDNTRGLKLIQLDRLVGDEGRNAETSGVQGLIGDECGREQIVVPAPEERHDPDRHQAWLGQRQQDAEQDAEQDADPAASVDQRTLFIGPPMAADKVLAAGVPAERSTAVRRGDIVQIRDLTVRAVAARHVFAPEPTPGAVGYVLECGGVSVHHSGDIEYDSEIVSDTRDVSASLICINGTAGNMNAHEAALLAWQQRTRLAIPFHYGLWQDADYGAGATLDPGLFVNTYHRLDPAGATLVLEPAAPVVVRHEGLAD